MWPLKPASKTELGQDEKPGQAIGLTKALGEWLPGKPDCIFYIAGICLGLFLNTV